MATFPDPMPVGAKFLSTLPPIAYNYLHDLVDYIEDQTESPGNEWRRLEIQYHDTDNPTPKDDQYITFDVAKIDGGNLDGGWVTSDYTTAETAIITFLTSTANTRVSHSQAVALKWYRRQFNPYTNSKPFAPLGPAVRVLTLSMNGTGTGRIPPQCAITVTEKTPWPHHWGRFYLPADAATNVSSTGRLDPAVQSEIANATEAMYHSWSTAHLYPVVAVTQVAKVPERQLLSITAVQVDDVWDVQRRRRFAGTSTRVVVPIT